MRCLCFLFLTGCIHHGIDVGSTPTKIDPHPTRAGLRDDQLIIAIPILVESRADGGVRSLIEIRTDIKLTNPVSVKIPLIPNGVVIGPRIRWR